MKMKKLFCGLIAGVMAASALTGCANKQRASDNDGRISISMYMWGQIYVQRAFPLAGAEVPRH